MNKETQEILEACKQALQLAETPTTMQQVWDALGALSDDELQAAIDRALAGEDTPMMRLTAHRTEAVMVDHNNFTQPAIMHAIARAARGEACQYKTRGWVLSCSLDDARTVGAALQYLWAGNVEPAIEFISAARSRNNKER